MKKTFFLTIFLIFLCGCINIDINQKLKRSGNYDLSLSIDLPEEIAGMAGGIKDSFIIEDSIKDKVKFSQKGNSIYFKFRDINPENDLKLFEDIKPAEINDKNTINAEMGFLDPGNLAYKKEFRFPNYYYSFRLKTDNEKRNETVNISWESHLIDNSCILGNETISKAMAAFKTIFSRADVETVAWTKTDYNNTRWNKAKKELLDNFSFRNTGEKYILISISPAIIPTCKIESNLYFDFNFFENISGISTGFSKECQLDINAAVNNATAKLEKLFLENSLNTSTLSLFGDELFSINYTVEVFGRILNTNGDEISKNMINFEIFPEEELEYYVEFKESIFSAYKLMIASIIILLIGLYLLPVIVKHLPKSAKKKEFKYPLSIDQRIVEYVIKAREYGTADEKIRKNLIISGWKPRDVDDALKIRH